MEGMILRLKKYLRTDIRYVLHGGFHMTTEYVVSVGAGIGFGFLVANLLNPTEYGIYKYVLAVGATIGALTFTGFSASLTQSIARGFEGSFRSTSVAQFLWSFPSLFICLSTCAYYLYKDAYVLGMSILAITLCIPFRDFGALYTAYLSGKELFRLKARLNIIRTIVVTGILICFAYAIPEAHVMVTMQYLFEALGFILTLFFVLKYYPIQNDVVGDEVSLGKHLSYVDVIQRVFGQFDKLFTFQFLGATALATYSIALMPVLQLTSLSKIIKTLVAPRFSKRSFREIHSNIFHKALMMTLFSAIIMGIYMLMAPYLYRYLLPQYSDLVPLSQLSALALLFTSQTLFGQALVAQGCKKQLYTAAILGNVLLVGTVVLGSYWGGVPGALVGFVVSRGLNLLIGILVYYQAYREHVRMHA